MAKTEKIIRDPLYNYVTIDGEQDPWLLDLIDTREVQRLRRIHQLGISHFTYPGADHSRLSHTLGVLHLTQQAWRRIASLEEKGPGITHAREYLLAAAVLHDVGHGPFSHLFENPLGIDHEEWSCRIIRSEDTEVNQVLCDPRVGLAPDEVTALIEKKSRKRPPWQKALLSSQLDVDRLDYLRRDSYFSGAGYGHFDWFRILSSFFLDQNEEGLDVLVWPKKSMYAIEEYIFSRFYMYYNVYQHKTTRGFEKLLHAAWDRAKHLQSEGKDPWLVKEIADFFFANPPTIKQYLALEDATLIYQVQVWSRHDDDPVLRDLARRFLHRDGFAAVDDLVHQRLDDESPTEWDRKLWDLVAHSGFHPPECYALRDDLKLDIYDPYMPEKEEELQDPYNAIMVCPQEGARPQEISTLLDRLRAVTGKRPKRYRYYVPKECRDAAEELASSRDW